MHTIFDLGSEANAENFQLHCHCRADQALQLGQLNKREGRIRKPEKEAKWEEYPRVVRYFRMSTTVSDMSTENEYYLRS